MTDESKFNPDELEEMARRLEEVLSGENEGYEMVFYIKHNDAIELVEAFSEARHGEPLAMARCWTEFAKIMERLEQVMFDQDDDL